MISNDCPFPRNIYSLGDKATNDFLDKNYFIQSHLKISSFSRNINTLEDKAKTISGKWIFFLELLQIVAGIFWFGVSSSISFIFLKFTRSPTCCILAMKAFNLPLSFGNVYVLEDIISVIEMTDAATILVFLRMQQNAFRPNI